jgi:TRAP-type transport system periplasmic protein
MRRHVATSLIALGAVLATAGSAHAQELERTHLKIVGENTAILNYSALERPFWEETIPAASGGQVTADLIPFDQMGLDNATILRLLRQGVMDIGTTDMSRLAADDPRFEACDLAGLSLSIEDARRACEAYRPVFERLLEEGWDSKLLLLGSAQPQVFWCRTPVTSLADLEGKKVRVFNRTMTDFLEGIGATAVSLAFPEVIPALERGVVDCAVTGTASGNTAGWPEVTTHIFPIYLGWAIRFTAVNKRSWDRLDPAVQGFLIEQAAIYEDHYWETMKRATEDSQNCNVGIEPCTMAKLANMTLVEISEADVERNKGLIESAVLAGFAERCGRECVLEWNATVGQALGLTAPLPQ